MNRIIDKKEISPEIFEIIVENQRIATKARAGQFIVLLLDEKGERVPLTIADSDPSKGTINIVFLCVGKTTTKLRTYKVGDTIHDIVGPMGKPSHLDGFKNVYFVAGGVGAAAAYPIAKAMKEKKKTVKTILGAKTKELLVYRHKLKNVSDELFITTDDGSEGFKGLTTEFLNNVISDGERIDLVMTIGPAIMMKFVAKTTEPYRVKTIASLNPIMVDATGMCGACRVEVGGQTKFGCVDGPEFDAHDVDWDLLLMRQSAYLEQEKQSLELFESQQAGNKKGGCRCQPKD